MISHKEFSECNQCITQTDIHTHERKVRTLPMTSNKYQVTKMDDALDMRNDWLNMNGMNNLRVGRVKLKINIGNRDQCNVG